MEEIRPRNGLENLIKIFGKTLSEYLAFARAVLGLMMVVGIARLALSLAGMPNSTVKWFSMTGVGLLGMVYFAIRTHTSGFGSYKQLLPLYLLQGLAANAIIIPAIALAIFTGTDNIFSAPEFSGGQDGKTWTHAGAHLLLGIPAGSLLSWVVGSLILFVTKKLSAGGRNTKAVAGA